MARSTRRLVAALTLAAATAVGVGACSPITTMQSYAPSDGVQGELEGGDVRVLVENLMVLSAEEGAPGTVLGALVNRGAEAVEVTLSNAEVTGGIQLTVEADSTLLLSPDHEDVVFPAVPVPPGAVLELQVSTEQTGSITLPVPVLNGDIPPYGEYLPSSE
ncbi:hypothetical protein IM660_03735 [Ruania alkalisoli]|uniref:DNA modification methylase n=1 Tax=Ruania alkalisoli TaxID=2779775 RepID=A0A7M1SVB5_9MICO|nr:hypothetical protein [Ruania alkalisoli]QOR71421.1 hypothetical protein IM660_03735 [Ruania alkalisoli]